jgi:hypothetical protein
MKLTVLILGDVVDTEVLDIPGANRLVVFACAAFAHAQLREYILWLVPRLERCTILFQQQFGLSVSKTCRIRPVILINQLRWLLRTAGTHKQDFCTAIVVGC